MVGWEISDQGQGQGQGYIRIPGLDCLIRNSTGSFIQMYSKHRKGKRDDFSLKIYNRYKYTRMCDLK